MKLEAVAPEYSVSVQTYVILVYVSHTSTKLTRIARATQFRSSYSVIIFVLQLPPGLLTLELDLPLLEQAKSNAARRPNFALFSSLTIPFSGRHP